MKLVLFVVLVGTFALGFWNVGVSFRRWSEQKILVTGFLALVAMCQVVFACLGLYECGFRRIAPPYVWLPMSGVVCIVGLVQAWPWRRKR